MLQRPQDGSRAALDASRPPRRWVAAAFLALLVGLSLNFAALGNWQLHRRAWKLDLIAAVNSRVHQPPAPVPTRPQWRSLTAAKDAYRHVTVQGVFLNDRESTVQALTELGPGYWVMTPLVTRQGFTVMINRGFVPFKRRSASSRPLGQIAGVTTVTGLLRMTEPGGGFLQRNDPAGDRWYSRDVAGIAAARHLSDVAPYFVDAEAVGRRDAPVGGLTVIAFPNSHLVYAVTWFTLAILCACAAMVLVRTKKARKNSVLTTKSGMPDEVKSAR